MGFIKLIWDILVKRAIVTRCWWCVHGRISVIWSQRDFCTGLPLNQVYCLSPVLWIPPRLNLILCWSAWCQWVQCRGASAHKQHGCSWCRGTPQWHCQSSPVSGVLVWRPIPSYLHSASLSWGVGQEWGQTGCSPFQPSTLPALQHTQGQFYVLDSCDFTSVTLTCKVNGFFHIIFAAQGKGQGFPICHIKEWTR